MSNIENLLVSHTTAMEVSRHPAVQELQLLQLTAEHEGDSEARDLLYERNMPLAAEPILGRGFVVDARLAVGLGRAEDEEDLRRLVFERGLMFFATATIVGRMVDLGVPTDSAGIGFETPRPVTKDASDDIELLEKLTRQRMEADGRVELDFAWIPIGALRRCAIQEMPAQTPRRLKDDYLMQSTQLKLEELGIIKPVTKPQP